MSDTAINIIGWGSVAPADLSVSVSRCDATTQVDAGPYLRDPKMRKFMAKQDKLAVQAAAEAVRHAGLLPDSLAHRTGIYLTVGLLPFEQQPLDTLYRYSVEQGRFSMARFSSEAVNRLNPLLTFQCLPNMPLFHISYNLGIHGRYFITYPGGGQWFQALQQASADLNAGVIDYALLGAVADQDNALVRHLIRRQMPQYLDGLIDSACVFVLSKSERRHSYARLGELQVDYTAADPLARDVRQPGNTLLKVYAGACDPSLYLALSLQQGTLTYGPVHYDSYDGIRASLEVHDAS